MNAELLSRMIGMAGHSQLADITTLVDDIDDIIIESNERLTIFMNSGKAYEIRIEELEQSE